MALEQPPEPKASVLNTSMFSQVWYRWFTSVKDEIDTITAGGEVNTASNLGAGEGVYASKSGANLQFKSFTAGSNITLTGSGTEIEIASSGGGGGGASNYYSSIAAPQLFNPDTSGVSGNTDDFTLANSNPVAFVAVNGQVLDDSEYSLASTVLTVTPDNGFTATSDEVLVFQGSFTYDLASTVTRVTTTATIGNSARQWNCNTDSAGYTVTLPVGVAGEEYKVVNTGTSNNTLTIAPNGSEDLLGENSNFSLADGEALTVAYDATDGWY